MTLNEAIEHAKEKPLNCGREIVLNVRSSMNNAVAWLPLPEPYKEDEHD